MHNLHFQGLVDEAILIDAPTQNVTLLPPVPPCYFQLDDVSDFPIIY